MANSEENYLIQQQIYKTNAFKLIEIMLDWCDTQLAVPFMKELLHSIFFLAKMCPVSFRPDEIFPNRNLYDALVSQYPEPVGHLHQFPKRSPFSSALDMVILRLGSQNEGQIKEQLQDMVQNLEEAFPVSTIICISQRANDSPRHYGVSMSTTVCNPNTQIRKIMIAASCCRGSWDDDVAGAVMTLIPSATRGKRYRDFDGTITVPTYVRCESFEISSGIRKAPCVFCGKLFGLPTTETAGSTAGNCAEVESLSKLFKNDTQVKTAAAATSRGTAEVRELIRADILTQLNKVLHERPYQMAWDGNFYTPPQN